MSARNPSLRVHHTRRKGGPRVDPVDERSRPTTDRPATNNLNPAATITAGPDRSRRRSPHSEDYQRGFVAGWLDRAQYAERTSMTFNDGVEFGWYMASRRMNNAIAEACQGMPHDAAEVVRRLVRDWDRG